MFGVLFQLYCRFRNDSRAVTAMEYGLIAALIAVVIIASLTSIGTSLVSKFNDIKTALGGK